MLCAKQEYPLLNIYLVGAVRAVITDKATFGLNSLAAAIPIVSVIKLQTAGCFSWALANGAIFFDPLDTKEGNFFIVITLKKLGFNTIFVCPLTLKSQFFISSSTDSWLHFLL